MKQNYVKKLERIFGSVGLKINGHTLDLELQDEFLKKSEDLGSDYEATLTKSYEGDIEVFFHMSASEQLRSNDMPYIAVSYDDIEFYKDGVKLETESFEYTE